MGLNVGGIYLKAREDLTQNKVADFIKEFWIKQGAKISTTDPLSFRPLSLRKTGLLGFAVFPKAKDIKGQEWIGIYDSERYYADPKLAEALAKMFNTEVWFYEITDVSNFAHAAKYVGKNKISSSEYSRVIKKAESFPYSFIYFNHLKELDPQQTKNVNFLAFESVPYIENQYYSGPDPKRLKVNQQIAVIQEFVRKKEADALLKLSLFDETFYEVIIPVLESTILDDQVSIDFIYKLGPLAVKHKHAYASIIEAAIRKNDEGLLKSALSKLLPSNRKVLEDRADDIEKKDPYIAFRLLEVSSRLFSDPRIYNNAVYQLAYVMKNGQKVDPKYTEDLLKKAYKAGAINPWILHNLANVYVFQSRYEEALDCITKALQYGYPEIELLKKDEDLLPIRKDPRFKEAFSTINSPKSLDYLKDFRVSPKGKKLMWTTPAIGLHLYLEGTNAHKAVADLMERLYKDFPKMFSFFKPIEKNIFLAADPSKVKKQVKRMREMKKVDEYIIYYNALAFGEACDQRFYAHLVKNGPGIVSITLPVGLTKDPEKLAKRLIEYASMLPFTMGNGGYSISTYLEGHSYSRTTNDIFHILESHWGFTVSQIETGFEIQSELIVPSWLTFVNKRLASKTKPKLEKIRIKGLISKVADKGLVIQAAYKPFVGLASHPIDLEYLPEVVKALGGSRLNFKDTENAYAKMEIGRLDKVKNLKLS
jgi:hypothetical protein